VERYYDGTSNPCEETPTDIHIDDNCGTSVILRPSLTIRVYENCCSILPDAPMGNYSLNDNPKREITTVINNVRQVEPGPDLFEIPKDYKISNAN
jgi:hypothetical protein